MTKDSPDGTSSLVTITYNLQILRMALFTSLFVIHCEASLRAFPSFDDF